MKKDILKEIGEIYDKLKKTDFDSELFFERLGDLSLISEWAIRAKQLDDEIDRGEYEDERADWYQEERAAGIFP